MQKTIKSYIVAGTLLLTLGASMPLWAQQNEPIAKTQNAQNTLDRSKNAELFSKGLDSKYRGNITEAIDNFEKALEFFPDDAASMFELCELYAAIGRNEESYAMISKAASLDPENEWYLLRLGNVNKAMGLYDKAIEAYQKVLDKKPGDLEVMSMVVDAMELSGQYDDVIQLLDKMEEQIGASEAINLEKIKILKLQNKPKELLKSLQKMAEEAPENTKYLSILAQTYMEMGKSKDALNCYLKIKEVNPEDPYINISLLEYYDKNGELDKAFDELIAAIKNKNLETNVKIDSYKYWFEKGKPSDELDAQAFRAGTAFVETHPDNSFGYFILGSYYFNKENYTESHSMYEKALTYDSTSYGAWYQLVFTDVNLKNYEATLKDAQSALRFFPNQDVFYWFAGVSAAILEQLDDAIGYFEKGRKFVTDKKLLIDFDTYLGDLYREKGDKEQSYDSYDRVLRNDPDNILVLNNYAYYLSLDSLNLEKALQMAGHVIELEPKQAMYLDTYAWVFYVMGRYEDAEKWMKKALDAESKPAGIYLEHYGDILYRLDNKSEAMQYWKKARKAGEGSELLEKKIKDGVLYE